MNICQPALKKLKTAVHQFSIINVNGLCAAHTN